MNRSYLYAVAAMLCFSAIGVLVKLIGSSIPPLTLTFYRMLFGTAFLLMVMPFLDKKVFRLTRKDAGGYFVVGMLLALNSSLYTSAHFFAPVQNVVLINAGYPFFVMLFAYFLLGEKIGRAKAVTLGIALAGLTIINPFNAGENSFGNLLALGSAVAAAAMIVEMRKEDKNHSIGDVLWFLFFASALLFPAAAISGFGDVAAVWPYVLLIGALSTGLAYLLYNLALQEMEAGLASLISITVKPLAAIALAALLIGEIINFQTVAGGAILVLAALFLEIRLPGKKKLPPAKHYH